MASTSTPLSFSKFHCSRCRMFCGLIQPTTPQLPMSPDCCEESCPAVVALHPNKERLALSVKVQLDQREAERVRERNEAA